jgi:hypothetical protein
MNSVFELHGKVYFLSGHKMQAQVAPAPKLPLTPEPPGIRLTSWKTALLVPRAPHQ